MRARVNRGTSVVGGETDMRQFVLLLAAATAGLAASDEAVAQPVGPALLDQLYTLTESCRDLGRPRRNAGRDAPPAEAQVAAMLGWMLQLDSPACRDLPARAAARIDILIGTPERPDVPLAFLALGWRSAAEGRGRTFNPRLAERYGRILWLLSDEPPSWPEWTDVRQNQWLSRPEQIALLDAYLSGSSTGRQRQARMLAELRLRRDLPGYDPRRAAELFGRAGDRARQAELLAHGSQGPADDRAAATVADSTPQHDAPVQRPSREAPAEATRLAVATPQTPPVAPAPRTAPVQQAPQEAPARQTRPESPAPPTQREMPAQAARVPVQQARREAPAQLTRPDPPAQQREVLAQPAQVPIPQAQRDGPAQQPRPAPATQQAQRAPPARQTPSSAPVQQAQRGAPAPPTIFQPTLLQVGQRAAESAQTDQERADALRTLFAASLEGGSESCTALTAQLGRVRASTFAALTREDLDRIERALRSENSGITLNPGGRALRPVLTRGLLDASGRLVLAQIVSSSGSTAADQAVLAGWSRLTGRLTLASRSRGAAWVPLPPSFPTGEAAARERPAARSACL